VLSEDRPHVGVHGVEGSFVDAQDLRPIGLPDRAISGAALHLDAQLLDRRAVLVEGVLEALAQLEEEEAARAEVGVG
jgi:hypothetical protein